VHVHQPQVAALADIWQVHFLSRANADAGGLTPASSLRDRFHRLEQQGVVRAEDHYLTRIPSHTEVVFCSDWLRDQFSRYYPLPANHAVLTNPGPPATPEPDPSDRSTARHHFGLPDEAFVVGFLGGTDPRKGYRELVDRVADEPDVHLLMAGSGSNSFRSPRLGPRLTTTEWLDGPEKDSFFTAIDALAVPSRFDPWPVVVNEAAARGIPVLVSPTTGSCTMVDRERVGLVWDPLREPLGPAISALREHGDEFAVNARRLADRLSFDQQAERLRELYEAAAERRRARPAPS
jgi:glycosyltransferase involved in cell wall biosynthesis